MKKLIVIILSLLLISMYGCAKRQTQTSFDSSDSSTSTAAEKPKPKYEMTVERDDFQKKTTFTGNRIKSGDNDIFLRGWKVDSLPNADATVQIYAATQYLDLGAGWSLYEVAYDSDGTRFEIVQIRQDVSREQGIGRYYRTLHEDIGITVTKQYLESHKDKELKFQISGKGGKTILYIPAEYTRKFLDAIKGI